MNQHLMRRTGLWVFLLSGAVLAQSQQPSAVKRTVKAAVGTAGTVQQIGNYVVIGWNDLGMHCINPRFKEIILLPPYNNLMAIVIRKGEEPHLVTSGITLTYSLDQNTTVVGKTDFWQYAPQIFGPLPLGVGLTGNGLSGRMKVVGDHFEATGVPVLPFNDNMTWNPYQHATIKLSGNAKGQTAFVVPISDEMNCQKCHATGGVAAPGINTPTLEGNILTLHDQRQGTNLMASRPVLCAGCHSDNALGKAGVRGVPSLSLAMHSKHASLGAQPKCYDCHPGAKTQCNRSAATGMGPTGTTPNCEKCHGTLTKVAADLKAGRQPWLQEPTCAQCHGAKYSTGTTLFRKAKGHGGVYCIACHNSPHAWYPSKRTDDNTQPLALQGNNHAIGYKACFVCHTDRRTGTMPPHGGDDGGGD
jgi:hypothetical protein